MLLNPYHIRIKTGGIMVAVLHEDTAQKFDLHVGDRIRLKSDRTELVCMLDITKNGFPKSRVGLFSEAYEALNIDAGDVVEVSPADKPASLLSIRSKLDGQRLSSQELNQIVKDIVEGHLSEVEMTYFVSGCYAYGLDDNETAALTNAIVNNGKKLHFKNGVIADKHCIGGVPGNRVTPLVIPIVVAAGILMPKTSSRAITSPAGTADAVETICNVTITAPRLQKIAEKVGGFMVWGGGVDLAAADDHMIKIRNPISLDPEGMLLASIMAKKHSVSANHVLIDIPIGDEVKMKNAHKAQRLKKRFAKIGTMLGMKVHVIITDGSQPIGYGVGPFLEMVDVMNVLKNDPAAPADLREKGIMESGLLLEMSGKAPKGKGKKMAEKILQSGKAWKKFNEIIDAQGRKKFPKPALYQLPVNAAKTGTVKVIHNKLIAHIARLAGAPKDSAAGLVIHKKIGDRVKKGDPLYTLHANNKDRGEYALDFALKNSGYEISN